MGEVLDVAGILGEQFLHGIHPMLPSNPFTQAARYALEREAALRVFLEGEYALLDTK